MHEVDAGVSGLINEEQKTATSSNSLYWTHKKTRYLCLDKDTLLTKGGFIAPESVFSWLRILP